MPRISGVTIPDQKRIEISLTYIYGIGPAISKSLLEEAKIDPNMRAGKLSEAELDLLRSLIDSKTVEGDLRREVSSHIKRLRDIGSFVGVRHTKGLPVHGQRTKTNARMRRGRKMTMGSGRRGPAQKT